MLDLGQHKALEDSSNPMSSGATLLIRRYVEAFSELWKPKLKMFYRQQMIVANGELMSYWNTDAIGYLCIRYILTSTSGRHKQLTAARSLGKLIILHLRTCKVQKELGKLMKYVESDSFEHRRRVVAYYVNRLDSDTELSGDLELYLGIRVVQALVYLGLLSRTTVRKKTKVLTWIDIAPEVLSKITDINKQIAMAHPPLLPMVEPPLKWTTGWNDGGYYTIRLPLVQHKTKFQRNRFQQYNGIGPENLRAVNKLQNVAYTVNPFMYDVYAKLVDMEHPSVLPEIDIPLPPKQWDSEEEYKRLKSTDPMVIRKWKAQAEQVYDLRLSHRGKRILAANSLWQAKRYLGKPFWYTFMYDWRGRIYTRQSYMTFQGADAGKSLVYFNEGVTLSDPKWLKIQAANHAGLDKATYDERIAWFDSNLEFIRSAVDHPLDDMRWLEVDGEPFQFLCAAHEYVAWERDKANFKTRLPIFVDGSNNGLQHYSAMLRDPLGGTAVNLVPNDRPNDVYQLVADNLRSILSDVKDPLARPWLNVIDRSLVKRPTMTYVYSVSAYGVNDQVFDFIRDKDGDKPGSYLGVEGIDVPTYVRFLGKYIIKAIEMTVVAAKDAMDWLKECQRRLEFTEWLSPSGFKVINAYPKYHFKTVLVNLFSEKRVQVNAWEEQDKFNKSKQINGICPNLIHSFDAAHLVKTVNTFPYPMATVHDSYGTYAPYVDELQATLRKEFIGIHWDSLQYVYNQLLTNAERCGNIVLPEPPKLGGLKLQEVLESKYFFH